MAISFLKADDPVTHLAPLLGVLVQVCLDAHDAPDRVVEIGTHHRAEVHARYQHGEKQRRVNGKSELHLRRLSRGGSLDATFRGMPIALLRTAGNCPARALA